MGSGQHVWLLAGYGGHGVCSGSAVNVAVSNEDTCLNIMDYRKQIDAALKYSGGTHLFEDVALAVFEGRMQMWANGETVAITEVICYPRKKVLHVFLAGGELDQVVDMVDSAKYWGKMQGCSSMTLAGRKGWVKALAHKGFEHKFTTLGVEI